jgi:RNA binding exosome subunit
MKYVHNIVISVFSKKGEDAEKIKLALEGLALLDLCDAKEKVALTDSVVKSHFNEDIHIFDITIKREAQLNRFLKLFIAKLSEDQRKLLVSQRESRVDDECHFYIRFDKRKLLEEDRLWITDSGDCFHLKFTLAAYPVKKEVGMRIVEKLFGFPSVLERV